MAKKRAAEKRGYVRRGADGAMAMVGEAKKREAKPRGAGGEGPWVVRDKKTKGYLTLGADGTNTMQPLQSDALQFATEDEAKAVAAVQLCNGYIIEELIEEPVEE